MRTITFTQREQDRATVTLANERAVVVVTVVERPDRGEGIMFSVCLLGSIDRKDIFFSAVIAEEHSLFPTLGDLIDCERLLDCVADVVFNFTQERIK